MRGPVTEFGKGGIETVFGEVEQADIKKEALIARM